ncbi:hypothetical protein N7G274_004023 [Stereocaulon virgatum]|uniref:BTB domain-containing protein n=1 Tax=Stereocaulon virgatum TaxID=373712 RepID=A0ABR4AB21_9LECA
MSAPHGRPQKEDVIESEKGVSSIPLSSCLSVPGKQRFDIHKGLLCEPSGRFQASLLGRLKEVCGKIELPEHAPATFAFFQHWLHHEKLRGLHDVDSNKPPIRHLRSVAQEAANSRKPREIEEEEPPFFGPRTPKSSSLQPGPTTKTAPSRRSSIFLS